MRMLLAALALTACSTTKSSTLQGTQDTVEADNATQTGDSANPPALPSHADTAATAAGPMLGGGTAANSQFKLHLSIAGSAK